MAKVGKKKYSCKITVKKNKKNDKKEPSQNDTEKRENEKTETES